MIRTLILHHFQNQAWIELVVSTNRMSFIFCIYYHKCDRLLCLLSDVQNIHLLRMVTKQVHLVCLLIISCRHPVCLLMDRPVPCFLRSLCLTNCQLVFATFAMFPQFITGQTTNGTKSTNIEWSRSLKCRFIHELSSEMRFWLPCQSNRLSACKKH